MFVYIVFRLSDYGIEYDLLELKTKKPDFFHIISKHINNGNTQAFYITFINIYKFFFTLHYTLEHYIRHFSDSELSSPHPSISTN